MMWGMGGSLAELARWVRQDGTVVLGVTSRPA
jgi:hypothetical protein